MKKPFPEYEDNDDVQILPPTSGPLRPSDIPGQKESKIGLGVLDAKGDDELAAHFDMLGKAQEAADKDIVPTLRRRPYATVGGQRINPVTMESLAMLQEIQSPFICFTPVLTPVERTRLQKLANRKLGNGEGGAKAKPLTKDENADLLALLEKAKEENAQFKNASLEILKFFAIHDPELDDDERETMVFDDPKALRRHALKCGRNLDMSNLDQLGEEIGRAIADAKSTKVRPVPKDRTPTPGNT